MVNQIDRSVVQMAETDYKLQRLATALLANSGRRPARLPRSRLHGEDTHLP